MFVPAISSKLFEKPYKRSYQAMKVQVSVGFFSASSSTFKTWWAAHSKLHPYLEIVSYFGIFPQRQQFHIDDFFHVHNNQITGSFFCRWTVLNLINPIACSPRYPCCLQMTNALVIRYRNQSLTLHILSGLLNNPVRRSLFQSLSIGLYHCLDLTKCFAWDFSFFEILQKFCQSAISWSFVLFLVWDGVFEKKSKWHVTLKFIAATELKVQKIRRTEFKIAEKWPWIRSMSQIALLDLNYLKSLWLELSSTW